ncbi:MAG: MATE family efflux transporter, partial [Muribaculaceae bacterium]|nr:MATE family efflux transporter [Muribaculaceae bacterium]
DLLTDDKVVVGTALRYLPWAVCIPLCGTVAFIYDGIFIGLTLTRSMLVSLLVGMAVFFVAYFALCGSMGNHGLWLAFLAYLAARGFVLHILLYRR